MTQHQRNTTSDSDGTGVEILPGAVVVHLDLVNLDTFSSDDLAAAMAEAEAQADEADQETEELLGDLDINPL